MIHFQLCLCPQDDDSESLWAVERGGLIKTTDGNFVYIEDDQSGHYVST